MKTREARVARALAGGKACFALHGRDFYVWMGRLGAVANRERDFDAGRLGGEACLRQYGKEHFRAMGKASAAKRRKALADKP